MSHLHAAARRPGQRPAGPGLELFYSFQGEGVNLGRRALFVRFRGMQPDLPGYATAPGGADVPADGKMLCDTDTRGNGRSTTSPRVSGT